jgi:hypothetical protein
VIDADGPVLATSNKRDLLDATREPRAGKGLVWVVDPNGIAGETPGFWWNPLSYVTGVTRARQLARIFVSAQRQPGESTDSYFDKAGPALIANLLLAAAVDGRPVTDLGDWLTRQTDRTPVQILRGKGFPSQGAEVEAVIDLHPKQRGGVFGTAQETMSFLTDPALAAWITPQAGAFDVQFDPDAFVRSTDTLYLLSKEGEGRRGRSSPRSPPPCARPPSPTPAPAPVGGSPSRCGWSSTRRRTSAAGVTSPTCTPTSGPN